MNEKPKLFISHSSRDNDVCQALARALEPDFQVKLDAIGLAAGDLWQREIEEWMGTCHGALVVLSDHAAASDWVAAEAYLLSWRMRAMPGSLRLIPVLLAPFAAAALDQHPFGPARLDATQAVTIDPAAPDLTAIRQGLGPLLAEFQSATAYREVERALAFHFRQPAGDDAIQAAAEALELAADVRPYARDTALWIARALLRADLDRLEDVVTKTAVFLRRRAEDVWRTAVPFAFVDPEAARQLAECAGRAPPRPALALNALEDRTPEHYVRRACALEPPWPILPSEIDGPERHALRDNVARVVAHHVGFDEPVDPTSAEFQEELADHVRRRGALIVLLPAGFEEQDAPLLTELVDAFRPVTFLLRTAAPLAAPRPNLLVLPPLDPKTEGRVYRAWRRLEKLLAGYS